MLWHLLFAHFTADYPLQSNWMAKNKIRWWVLCLHVAIHLVTMLVVTFPTSLVIWPYLVTIAAIHFCIDTVKNWFTIHHPHWRAWPYIIDQASHWLSLILVSAWINQAAPQVAVQPRTAPFLPQPAAVIGIGFVLVTFVAMISERVLLSGRPTSPAQHEPQAWTRLFTRAALLGLLLLGWQLRPRPGEAAGTPPVSWALLLPYTAANGGTRLLLVDLLVTGLTALLVILING